MKRIFYLVSNKVMQNYEWVKLVNPPYLKYDFHFAGETDFLFYLRQKKGSVDELKDRVIWSIPAEKQALFEQACSEVNIELKEYDMQADYQEFMQSKKAYIPSKQEEIAESDCVYVCWETIPHIECRRGTTQALNEHFVGEKDNIALYINSNEMTGHSIPHCHVKYNKIKNYCVLSLVDFEKIAPDGGLKNAVILTAQSILEKNIQTAREKWNEVHSLVKFKCVDGVYTSDFVR